MKNFVVRKILNQKLTRKILSRNINAKKLEAVKKILGQKVSLKNFIRKMEKIGLVGEKSLGQNCGEKFELENGRKKNLSSTLKLTGKILQFL